MPHTTPFNHFQKATAPAAFIVAGFLFRLAIAVMFLMSAWSKLNGAETWSAAAYLAHATGPFAGWFQAMAGNYIVDLLNIYGQLLIGLGVLFGCLLRPASFFGALLMALYYFSNLTANTAHGIVEEHVVLFFVFLLFLYGGFGHVWGIDGLVSRLPFVSRRAWLRKLF